MKNLFFWCIIYYQNSFFIVLVTIGPSCSLLTVCYNELCDFTPCILHIFWNIGHIFEIPSFLLSFYLSVSVYFLIWWRRIVCSCVGVRRLNAAVSCCSFTYKVNFLLLGGGIFPWRKFWMEESCRGGGDFARGVICRWWMRWTPLKPYQSRTITLVVAPQP